MSANVFAKGLPANIDAEKLVLGSILLNEIQFDAVAAVLSQDDFSLEKHRRIFARMRELHEAGEHIDRITVAEYLQRQGQLESVDGISYLLDLDSGLPEIPNLDSYIRIVEDKSRKRKAIFTLQSQIDELLEDNENASALLDKSEKLISDLRAADRRKSAFLTPEQIIQAAGGVDAFISPKAMRGIPTPWKGLNDLLTGGGFSGGQLIVVGGRPGGGKTSIASNIANHAARNGARPFVVSLEMSAEEMLRRSVCARANVNQKQLSHRPATREERLEIAIALAELNDGGLMIWDNQWASVPAVRSELRRLRAAGQSIGMVICDYVQLMDVMQSRRASQANRAELVAEVSRGLKLLARELDCPVIALSQLSRDSVKQDRRPQLSDLRDSGAIEQDADVVMFPYSKYHELPQAVVDYELIVAKQRNGPIGDVHLRFIPKYTKFEDAE